MIWAESHRSCAPHSATERSSRGCCLRAARTQRRKTRAAGSPLCLRKTMSSASFSALRQTRLALRQPCALQIACCPNSTATTYCNQLSATGGHTGTVTTSPNMACTCTGGPGTLALALHICTNREGVLGHCVKESLLVALKHGIGCATVAGTSKYFDQCNVRAAPLEII